MPRLSLSNRRVTLHQTGFTLVELAIVMTIIGLLIGGILKGQELMMNARITATIAQVRSYDAAMTLFRDSYYALPGDLLNASTRLAGCSGFCDPGPSSTGNNIIGTPTWAGLGWINQAHQPLQAANGMRHETTLFWIHLLVADLISGVSPDALSGAAIQWGVTHPTARLNGGFVIGYADGTANPPGLPASATAPSGHVISLVAAPNLGLTDVAGQQATTPARAAVIDRKMDDGNPMTGYVRGFGAATCVLTASGQTVYNEINTANDCGVMMRVGG